MPNPHKVLALIEKIATAIEKGIGEEEYANRWRIWHKDLKRAVHENRCRPESVFRPYLKLALQSNDVAWARRQILNKALACNDQRLIWSTFYDRRGVWQKERTIDPPVRIITHREHSRFCRISATNDNFIEQLLARQNGC